MIRILLLGKFTGIVVGNRTGNEYHYDRLVPDTEIDGNKVEHAGRKSYGENPLGTKRIRSFHFCYLKPGLKAEVAGYSPQTSRPVTVGYDET
jgi:hypothetical protein